MPPKSSPQCISDEVLFDRWCSDDGHAGDALFRRYFSAIERFFTNKMPGRDIDDLIQDTFLGCIRGRDRVKFRGKFRSYLFAVARNVLHSALRKKYCAKQEIDIDNTSVYDLVPDAIGLLMKHDEERLLLEGLRRIGMDQQVLLELYYWENFTTDELSEVLDRPAGTVKGQLQRARRALEQVLATLAESAELLSSTRTRLEDWAASCKRQFEQRFRKK